MTESPNGYLRKLRPWDAALVVVGGIIGGGIFLNPGTAAQRTSSGLSLLLIWIGAGVLTLVGALCYAELGARRPQAGGTYVYLREAFGPLAGFLFGWTMLLVIYSGSTAAVATIFASYAIAAFGLPPTLALPLTVGALVLVSGINLFGIRLGARIQNTFALLKLLAVAALVVCGLFLAGVGALARPRHRSGARACRLHGRRRCRCCSPTAASPTSTTSPAKCASRSAPCHARWPLGMLLVIGALRAGQYRLSGRARPRRAGRQHRAGGRCDAARGRPGRRPADRAGRGHLHPRFLQHHPGGRRARAAGDGRGRAVLPLGRRACIRVITRPTSRCCCWRAGRSCWRSAAATASCWTTPPSATGWPAPWAWRRCSGIAATIAAATSFRVPRLAVAAAAVHRHRRLGGVCHHARQPGQRRHRRADHGPGRAGVLGLATAVQARATLDRHAQCNNTRIASKEMADAARAAPDRSSHIERHRAGQGPTWHRAGHQRRGLPCTPAIRRCHCCGTCAMCCG